MIVCPSPVGVNLSGLPVARGPVVLPCEARVLRPSGREGFGWSGCWSR